MRRRQAWAAVLRRPEAGRLIQLAAAAGVAVFEEARAPVTVAAMRWLLHAAILAEQGMACGEIPVFREEGTR